MYIYVQVCKQQLEMERSVFNSVTIFEYAKQTYWDLLTTVLLIYTLFEIPFHVAFIETS